MGALSPIQNIQLPDHNEIPCPAVHESLFQVEARCRNGPFKSGADPAVLPIQKDALRRSDPGHTRLKRGRSHAKALFPGL